MAAKKKKKKPTQAQLDALARGRAKVAERRARASAATGTTKTKSAPKKKKGTASMATKKKKPAGTKKKGKRRSGARGSKSFLSLSKREVIAAGAAAAGIGFVQYMAAKKPAKAGEVPMKAYVNMPQITAIGRTGTLSLAAAGVSMLPIGNMGKSIAKGAAVGLGLVSLVAFARRGGKFYTEAESKLLVSGAPLDELRLDRPTTDANGELSLEGVSSELIAAINNLVQERANRAA